MLGVFADHSTETNLMRFLAENYMKSSSRLLSCCVNLYLHCILQKILLPLYLGY
jgi:hypothetical protein